MRVSVLQEKLAKGLSIVNRAIGSRPTMPILANVLIATEESRLKLAATNLELGITARCGANVESEGAITVPARMFLDLVNTLPPERVDLELDEHTSTLNIRCGGTITNIKGIESSQFPALSEADADTGMALPATVFKEMTEQVVFAAAKEDNRPILMGILSRFDGTKLTMVAADGFRLSLRTAELEQPVAKPITLIIPAKTLQELSRILGGDEEIVYVSAAPNRSQVMFHVGDVDIVSQLIDGKFPDVDHLVPKSFSTSTLVYTSELLRACKRSEIFARDANFTTKFFIKPGESAAVPGQLMVTSQSQEKGDNEGLLDASIDGPGLEISFNVRYLIEVLNVIPEERVALETTDAQHPGVIKPAGRQDFIYVIMPMSTR